MRPFVRQKPDSNLLQVVNALAAARRFAGRLNGRQQQRDQDADDRDDDQELDQSKTMWPIAIRMRRDVQPR
jgi:hypothetical protein